VNVLQETAVRLQLRSPTASGSVSRVSLEDLPSFTQNVMQTRCPSMGDKMKREVEEELA
jgi:hypothetical protein